MALACDADFAARVAEQTGYELPVALEKVLAPALGIAAMLALQGEIERLRDERAATPEVARRANLSLRRLMTSQKPAATGPAKSITSASIA